MIRISFAASSGRLTGFEIRGHSGYADEGSDIVCASVSSAAYMAVNTITEIYGIYADAKVSDGYMLVSVKADDERVDGILKGLRIHFEQLTEQYPAYVRILNDNQ